MRYTPSSTSLVLSTSAYSFVPGRPRFPPHLRRKVQRRRTRTGLSQSERHDFSCQQVELAWIARCKSYRLLSIVVVAACQRDALRSMRLRTNAARNARRRFPTSGDANRAIRGRPSGPSRRDDEQSPGSRARRTFGRSAGCFPTGHSRSRGGCRSSLTGGETMIQRLEFSIRSVDHLVILCKV